MSKITAIGNIPNMADGETILEIRGIIKQVWPRKKDDQGRLYTSQAFIISDGATGATTLVRAYHQPDITPDQVGQIIQITPRQDGGGLTKESFKRTTGDKAGQTDHSVKADRGAVIRLRKAGEATQSAPASGNARAEDQQSRQRQTSNPLKDAGDLLLECLHEASRIVIECPFELEGGAREIATTLFIELRKSGVKASMLPNRREQTGPAKENATSEAMHAPEPELKPELDDSTKPEPPAPQVLTPAALAAKAMAMPGSAEIARSLSVATTASIEKAADLLFVELIDRGDATPQQLDVAFDAWRKLQDKASDSIDPNTAMLASLDVFMDVLKRHAAPAETPKDEVALIEDDDIMPEIDV